MTQIIDFFHEQDSLNKCLKSKFCPLLFLYHWKTFTTLKKLAFYYVLCFQPKQLAI